MSVVGGDVRRRGGVLMARSLSCINREYVVCSVVWYVDEKV